MFSSIGSDLIPTIKRKQSMSSNLSGYDCAKCPAESSNESGTEAGQQEAVGAGEELTNDKEEDDEGAKGVLNKVDDWLMLNCTL